MSNFLSTSWARLRAETPPFFKKIRGIGQSLMATGTAAIATNIIPEVKMPAAISTLGTHAIVIGFVMTLVASFAVSDPTQLPKT